MLNKNVATSQDINYFKCTIYEMWDTNRWQHHRDTKQLLQSVQLKQNKSVI